MSTRRVGAVASALAVITVIAASCTSTPSPVSDDAVTVFGPYIGVDADRFAAVLDDFEAETGIAATYTGSVDFVSDLRQRSIGDERPDVAIVPQPGVAEALQESGALVPLDADAFQRVRDAYDADVLATLPWNPRFAVPYRSNTKSLVWYRPTVFAENGWSVPATLDELRGLVDEIDDADQMSPWCFSIFAGSATGWPATDWIEDLVLRRGGADAYDAWADGALSWQSNLVRDAFEEFQELVLAEGRSAGGTRAILQTEVAGGSAPLFASEPGCAMYKQASFAEDWFPGGTDIGPDGDVDFFVLPEVDGGGTHLVTGGDAAVAFVDDPDVRALMAYLADADGGRSWAEAGGFVSQRADVEIDDYYNDVDGQFAELFRGDDVAARFDASDVLPADIGSDLLWELVTRWISGVTTLDDLLATMDAELGLVDAEG